MAVSPRKRRWLMCGSKRRYDRRHAYMAAQSATERTGAAKRVYRCEFCGEWHITHKPKRGGNV